MSDIQIYIYKDPKYCAGEPLYQNSIEITAQDIDNIKKLIAYAKKMGWI